MRELDEEISALGKIEPLLCSKEVEADEGPSNTLKKSQFGSVENELKVMASLAPCGAVRVREQARKSVYLPLPGLVATGTLAPAARAYV